MSSQSVLLAASFYRDIVSELGIANALVSPESSTCTVQAMCAENAWLPKFMLRTDELAMLLIGSRIWNVAYVADHESFLGFRVDEIDDDVRKRLDSSYADVNVVDNCPFSLQKKLAIHAVETSVDFENGFAEIEPMRGYYNIQGTPEHGTIIPLPFVMLLQCHELNKVITSISQKRTIEYCLSRIRSINESLSPT